MYSTVFQFQSGKASESVVLAAAQFTALWARLGGPNIDPHLMAFTQRLIALMLFSISNLNDLHSE
jgi:hypothetical protein